MILYVNGDSHSAGHDAGGPEFSYGRHVADALSAEFVCDALAGCGNDRIIRTTKEYLKTTTPDFVIIGWSTWEREEWLHEGQAYMVAGGGHSQLPVELQERYKQWVIKLDTVSEQHRIEDVAHNKIWRFHLELTEQRIPHLFFNCYSHFFYTHQHVKPKYPWGNVYIDPYDQNMTYYFWLEQQGFKPANPKFYHYGADAHIAWADFLLPKIKLLLT
jgi:hypothetical protein